MTSRLQNNIKIMNVLREHATNTKAWKEEKPSELSDHDKIYFRGQKSEDAGLKNQRTNYFADFLRGLPEFYKWLLHP